MIVITGATGKLGRSIVESLLTRMPADQIGVSVRNASKAADLAERGVRVREADFDNPAALDHAFEGAEQVLIISTDTMGESSVARSIAAADAAVAAGAKRVLYTSHMGSSRDSKFQACVDHSQVEDHLATSGISWTALRNGFYASSAVQFAEYGIPAGDAAVPEDGPVSWTTHRDLADAAAAILAGEATFEGPTPPLTSSQVATFEDIARIGGELTAREVKRTVIADEKFVEQMTSYGTPPAYAEQLLGILRRLVRVSSSQPIQLSVSFSADPPRAFVTPWRKSSPSRATQAPNVRPRGASNSCPIVGCVRTTSHRPGGDHGTCAVSSRSAAP